MTTVRITQLDGTLPNLALMRLSAWYKARGAEVHFWRTPYRQLGEPAYDHVLGSAIFKSSATLISRLYAEFPGENTLVGGTGTGEAHTVDQIIGDDETALDYSLYPDFTASLGFTQRGCRMKCKFCVVPAKEGKPVSTATVADIWRGDPYRRHIHLLDNDFFGQPATEWQDRIREIRDGRFKVCINQGINVRLITQETAEALASINYRDDQFKRKRLYTAWDNLKDEGVFFRGVETLERAGIPSSHLMAYMLVGFAKDETMDRVLHRFHRMTDRRIKPYVMLYDRSRADLRAFQRWSNSGVYRAVPWAKFNPRLRRSDIVDQGDDLFGKAA